MTVNLSFEKMQLLIHKDIHFNLSVRIQKQLKIYLKIVEP